MKVTFKRVTSKYAKCGKAYRAFIRENGKIVEMFECEDKRALRHMLRNVGHRFM